ncbi:Protein phosphatase 1D like protein [Argiope bruennichi]|uniref:Protein phosphatase 1D like protein n=1 Tax=Argiope bruennichi TaxID=94029 RepID=A0A8T0FN15_ARGBR|nr:Protein phosphatase 1D like protein [Argiope bruennichi]
MTPSIGLNLRVTGHCNQGGRKYMEDAFVVAYQQSEDQKDLEYAYFGIFDGHGGREAALFAKEHLMNNIVCQKSFWSDDDNQVLKAIRYGFLATHHAMWREVGKWPKTVSGLPSTSGTTSSIAFIRRRKLYIGHVGDSKIVLGFQIPGSSEWRAFALTKDHKPETPEEKKRINSVGGLVMNKAGVERVVWNRPRPGHKGPIRRSTPFDQIPFLAVARSLGDLWSYNYVKDEFIVSPEPDVKVISINPNMHRCVIFASDGLWNMLSTQCAVKIVQAAEEENEKLILEGGKANGTGKQPNNPSKLLVDAALKHWLELGMRADNTSVVTVMLDPPGPPKSEVLLRQRVMKRLRPRDDQPEEGVEAKNSNLDTPTTPIIKEKRKPIEGNESQLNRERKRSSDSAVEMVNKERKLSSDHEESVPKNLPKPVILSPQRVVKQSSPVKPVLRDEIIKSPENVSSPTVPISLMRSKKKIHDPPNWGGSSSTMTAKESENENREESINKPIATTEKPILIEGASETPMLNESGQEKLVPNVSPVKTDSCVSKPEKDDTSLPKSANYPISKENGRVHLCEVDNIFKLNERTTECFENSDSSKQSEISPKSKTVPSTVKNFRKSTITRRNSSFPAVKRPRVHQRNFSSCRTNTPRKGFAHNTRAQSGIRKLKV